MLLDMLYFLSPVHTYFELHVPILLTAAFLIKFWLQYLEQKGRRET
jgi:hypothetical protein